MRHTWLRGEANIEVRRIVDRQRSRSERRGHLLAIEGREVDGREERMPLDVSSPSGPAAKTNSRVPDQQLSDDCLG